MIILTDADSTIRTEAARSPSCVPKTRLKSNHRLIKIIVFFTLIIFLNT